MKDILKEPHLIVCRKYELAKRYLNLDKNIQCEKPISPASYCCGALTWLAVAPAEVGDSAPTGLRKRGGLSTGEFRRL